MESLLGKSLVSESIALCCGAAMEKSDAHVWIGRVKAANKEHNVSSPCTSSGSNPSTLPIPSSKSLFPGPLKFLWFSNEVSEVLEVEGTEEPPDHIFVAEQLENEYNRSETVSLTEETEDSRKSWTDSIWRLKTMLPGRNPALEDVSSSEEQNSSDTEEVSLTGICRECEMDECFVEGSMLEVPHVQVTHNRESFSEFLQPMSLSESREISRMAHLCNLAYKIRDIKPSELFSHHQLRFVTSSLEKKDEALADSSSSAPPVTEEKNEEKQGFSVTPSSAYGLASAVASYLHSRAKMLLRLKKQNEVLQKEQGDGAGPTSAEDGQMAVGDAGTDYESSEMASFIASSPVTAVVAAKEGTKDAVAKDLQSLHNCPCEWYCCDDRRNSTRYFVIQGSESLASWQANLLFEPTHFEDSSLGVFVHRGIYEAAKGLYEQLLPCVLEHLKEHGERAQLCFTGHSLGGSLGTLVSLMLQIRGVVQPGALLPVMTFGSPCIMCGGDYLLEKLGLPEDHVRSVMLHRDIVPRTFACNYPDHVAEILKRLNGSFRDHPCLNNQRLLYAPMGQFIILQPAEDDAPPHPLLPSGLGLYGMKHPQKSTSIGQLWPHSMLTGQDWSKSTVTSQQKVEVRAAQRAFLNSPHPLEILSDPGAYGNEGSISRDHDPRSYLKSVLKVVREEARKQRRLKRQQRRGLWWPLMRGEFSSMFENTEVLENRRAKTDYSKLVGVNHTQIVLVFFLSAKVMLMQGFAAFFAWI